MKRSVLILILFFTITITHSQCEICGTYKGNTKKRSQKLIIKKDSSFVYEYTDNWATLMGATTKGTWKIIDGEIELNSEYNDEDFTITTKKLDLCKSAPEYYSDNCEKLIKIQVLNLNNEYIWHLKRVMINGDTSKISSIIFEDPNDSGSDISSSFLIGDRISQINIFNGFYDEFVVFIDNPNINYVKIKGNFSDILWYTYIKKERWKIRKNRLTQNRTFGRFKKI
jgi:hypothetical protein